MDNKSAKLTFRDKIMKNWLCTGGFCLIVCIGAYVACSMISEGLGYAGVESRAADTIGRFLMSAAVLAVYWKLFGLETFGLGREGFLRGILTGGFLLFVTVLNVYVMVEENLEYPMIMPAVGLIIMVIVEQIFVGIFEEFLFRGFLLNTLLIKFGEHKFSGKMAAVFISSVAFGLVHFINLQYAMVNAAISQVLTATFSGIFFAVLYLRARNIWAAAFYHTITNLAGDLTVIFFELPDMPAVDISVGDIFSNVAANMVLLLVGLFMARRLREE